MSIHTGSNESGIKIFYVYDELMRVSLHTGETYKDCQEWIDIHCAKAQVTRIPKPDKAGAIGLRGFSYQPVWSSL